ncbi:hypothetical protein [Flavobacterium sp. N1994]|uniref:hypothetical protein n=1 Tax=Flavobacterium sp. N1994 TaxID=2986827 RepID=UPI00222308E8|nr:hypothetical protein [Flavobacterium sp. N1994]
MARANTLVNAFGKMAGWNSVTLNFFGRDIEGIMEIGYDDTVEKELIYGAGKMPIGHGEGKYEAKVKIVLVKEEVTALLDAIPPGMRLQDAIPADMIVQYDYDLRIYKDILRNVMITKLGRSVKQGDKVVGQELECIVTHIDWNQ